MLLGIAGKIASGKSTLAHALCVRLKARRLGFGDYVRALARSQGLDASSRQVLQELGHGLATNNPLVFVEGLLASAGAQLTDNIVFDGIRHSEIWETIKAKAIDADVDAYLIFLDMPEQMRQQRLVARGLEHWTASGFDSHASESDLEISLRGLANLILDVQNETDLVGRVTHLVGMA